MHHCQSDFRLRSDEFFHRFTAYRCMYSLQALVLRPCVCAGYIVLVFLKLWAMAGTHDSCRSLGPGALRPEPEPQESRPQAKAQQVPRGHLSALLCSAESAVVSVQPLRHKYYSPEQLCQHFHAVRFVLEGTPRGRWARESGGKLASRPRLRDCKQRYWISVVCGRAFCTV